MGYVSANTACGNAGLIGTAITMDVTKRVKRHILSKEQRFFSVVQPGFERVLSEELQSAGIHTFQVYTGGIEFSASLHDFYGVVMRSLSATGHLMRVATFRSIPRPFPP